MSKAKRIAEAHEIIHNITRSLNELAEVLISDKSGEVQPTPEIKKKRRDPNAPKPPTSNFFLFTNSIRDEVDKEFPDATFAEKSKIYGARWQALSDEDRKPFTVIANEERDKYKEKLAAYEAERGEDHVEKKIKKETPAKTVSAPVIKASPTAKAVPTKASAAPIKASASTSKSVAAPTKASASTTKAATKEVPSKTAKPTKTSVKATKTAIEKTTKSTESSKPVKNVTAKPTKVAKAAPKPAPKIEESSSSESDSSDSSSSSSSDSDSD